MYIKYFLFIAMLMISEHLLRQDYLYQRVPKWGLYGLLTVALALRLLWLLERQQASAEVLRHLLYSFGRAALLILPMLLLYAVRKLPGPADIKYSFFCAFLLGLRPAGMLLIGCCIWASLSELKRSSLQGKRPAQFALLPYLILGTQPAIFMAYWP